MTDNTISQSHCCSHYPNRVLHKKDLAAELGVCAKTVDNLMKVGELPQPCWLRSKPVWMLYDVHAFISAQAARTPHTGTAPSDDPETSSGRPSKKKTGAARKAGKYCV